MKGEEGKSKQASAKSPITYVRRLVSMPTSDKKIKETLTPFRKGKYSYRKHR